MIKDVADLHVWRMCRVEIMFQILEQKASSYKPFRDALLDSGNSMLVEATQDDFWGVGLTPAEVKVTNPDFIKINGDNVLGELLMDLREQLRKEISHQTSTST